MTTTVPDTGTLRSLPDLGRPTAVRRWWTDPRGLLAAGAGAGAATAAVSLVGLVIADDSITGAPAWLKPLKFGVSVTAYLLTLRWVVGHVTGHRRLLTTMATLTALALGGELVGIVGQVVRGTTSHFNEATPFDTAVFDAMGAMVGVVFLLALVLTGLVLRQRGLDAGLAAGSAGGWE